MHCDDAPCIKDSPTATVYKREDGLVIIDPEKAKGQPEIVDDLPLRRHLLERGGAGGPEVHRLRPLLDEGWTETRCSQVCPTGAIKLVLADDAEMAAMVADARDWSATAARTGHQAAGLLQEPVSLEKVFVAGSVVFGDTDECAEGATLTVAFDGDARR